MNQNAKGCGAVDMPKAYPECDRLPGGSGVKTSETRDLSVLFRQRVIVHRKSRQRYFGIFLSSGIRTVLPL